MTLGVNFPGQPAISISAAVSFEKTTDANGSQVTEVAFSNLGVAFGSPTIFSVSGASGFFLLDGSTLAGEISVPLSFQTPSTSPTVSFNGTIELEFSNGSDPVNTTFTDPASGDTETLNLPAGPYLLLAGTGLNLTIYDPASNNAAVVLTGNIQFEDVSVPGTNGGAAQTELRIAVFGVSITGFNDPTYGSASLTNGQGAFIFLSGGVAGQLSGDFSFATGSGPSVKAGGEVYLEINTTASDVDQTIPLVSGGSLTVDVDAKTFAVGVSNASINIGNLVTLTGNFQVTSEPGMTLYGASNVTLFIGNGPVTNPDGSANPNAIGVEVTNAEIGAVDINGNYAVFAYGQAQLVGLSPLAVSGSLAVFYNDTGQAVDVSVPLPPARLPAR